MLLEIKVDKLERPCLLFQRPPLKQRLSERLDGLWLPAKVGPSPVV